MAVRRIVLTDNPILRSKSHHVPRPMPETGQLIADMLETMRQARGVGLAAIQVGVPLQVIVVEIPADMDDPDAGTSLALLNPELARVSEEMEEGVEGCLSIPGLVGEVSRHVQVTVKGLDPLGRKVRHRAEGYLARVLQHEIDHLHGTLFIDRASQVWDVTEGDEEAVEVEANGARRQAE